MALSQREVEFLVLVAEGLSDKEIAARLFLSIHTVRNHRRHAFAKLGVHKRVQAVIAWRRITEDVPDALPGEVQVTVRHAGLTWQGSVPAVPPPDC